MASPPSNRRDAACSVRQYLQNSNFHHPPVGTLRAASDKTTEKPCDTDAARSVPTRETPCLIKNYICETDEERIAQKKITSCLVVGV